MGLLGALLTAAALSATPGPAAPGSALELRILALGDSYTIGESVPAEQRWPVQLAALLRKRGLSVAEPQIIAKTGWTTDELSTAMDAATLTPPYDLVTLLIGVNNQYRGREVDNYRGEFRALLDRAIDLAGDRPERILVLSIPDWGVTPFAREKQRDAAIVAAEIDAYNAVNREEAQRSGIAWVNITPMTREAATDTTLLAEDGLHPSGRDYARWAGVADLA
ncbi:MAG: SGNH/GDSL hydrolase family protein, partial [Xanthomonadales bacterium]|nr:SGNH/GDSL hydrolase family protein [Xanthomonadales bacterium]